MKKLAIITMLMLAFVACKKSTSGSSESTMQIVNQEVDSTKYGIAIRFVNDSLQWVMEDADTLWISASGAKKLGTFENGHRLAVLFEQGSKTQVKSIIDMTELMGRWVEPDAVDEGMMQGVELQEGGAASSINSRANHYVSWRIYNGKLLLVNSLDGMIDQDAPEDTLYVTYLSKDSMYVKTSLNKHFYRRSNGDDDDHVREYEMYSSPDANAFDPEGSAPEDSKEEIPEYDKVF